MALSGWQISKIIKEREKRNPTFKRKKILYVVTAYNGQLGMYNIVDYNRNVYEYGNKKQIQKFIKNNKLNYIFR